MKTSWKERNVKLWEKIVCTYSMWKQSRSAKIILKLVMLILKSFVSILIKKILNIFIHNF